MAPRYDFDLTIGDSYPPGDGAKFTVTYSVRPTPTAAAVPYDITSATITGALIRSKADADSLVDFEIVKLNQVTNPGQFTFRIPASETTGLTPWRHFWRLALAWPGSNSKTTLVEGYVTVRHVQ